MELGSVGRHLKSWFTGRPVPGREPSSHVATVVLEDGAHLPALGDADVVGPRSVVLAPAGAEQVGPVPPAIPYEGSFSEPGSDISVAESIFVQTQDYATSPYVTLVGSTLVRIVGDVDLEAFLADADAAHAGGRLPEFLVSPAVQIADVTALGVPAADDGPRTRLYVAASGTLSTAPGGLPLGVVGDSLTRLDAEWRRVNATSAHPCAVALGGVLGESQRTAALDERPWLGRYLDALDLQRELAGLGVTEVRVSGFGGRLVPALAEIADADGAVPRRSPDAAPLLAWTPDAAYLRAPGSGRLFTLNRRVAEVAEVLLTLGGTEAAATYATPDSLAQVAALLDRHGVARPELFAGAAR
jgi:hypothetical protein